MPPEHVAYIHTRTPGPVKVAVCSCGWESTPAATAIRAVRQRQEHYESMRRPTPLQAAAGQGEETGGEE